MRSSVQSVPKILRRNPYDPVFLDAFMDHVTAGFNISFAVLDF